MVVLEDGGGGGVGLLQNDDTEHGKGAPLPLIQYITKKETEKNNSGFSYFRFSYFRE